MKSSKRPVVRFLGCLTACLATATLFVFVPVAVQPAPVAEASDCWQAMPWAPLGNVIVGTGAAGAFAVAPSLSSPVVLTGTAGAASGAAPAVAVLGSAGLAVGAFLAASAGTCKFIDWTTRDGDSMLESQEFVGLEGTTSSLAGHQDMGNVNPSHYYPNSGGIRVNFDPAISAWTSATRFRINNATFSVGGNNFPGVESNTMYPAVDQPGYAYLLTNSLSFLKHDASGTGGDPGPVSSAYVSFYAQNNGSSAFNDNEHCGYTISAVSSVVGRGIGGNCGLHPRTIGVVHEGSVVERLFYINDQAAAKGWARRIYTDAKCKEPGVNASYWVRAISEVYYDREVSARIAVPSCPVGSIPHIMRAQRVPVNFDCDLGDICYGTDSLIYQHTLPAHLTSFSSSDATNFPWRICLANGADCGEPALVEGICMWGGFVMPSAASCDPSKIAAIPANPVTVPDTVSTIIPVEYVEGEPSITTSWVEPDPSDPDPSNPVDVADPVTVPIDAGTGENTTTVADEVECWPGGWGWMNPAQWVLRPIKCAIEWSFVPSGPDLDERLAGFAALSSEPPLAWVSEGTEYVTNSSFMFDEWVNAGPECVDIMDYPVCPREWDNPEGVPDILVPLMIFGLWSALVFAIWRWF
jgi:hypothetical protein